jgi:hypothetical protein
LNWIQYIKSAMVLKGLNLQFHCLDDHYIYFLELEATIQYNSIDVRIKKHGIEILSMMLW